MLLPNLHIHNLGHRELTGIVLEALDLKGCAPLLEELNKVEGACSCSGQSPRRVAVPIHGCVASGRTRITLQFDDGHTEAFSTDGRPRHDGMVELESLGQARVRLLHSITQGRTLYTIFDQVPLTDWMASLPGDRAISALSLPGTHETCARKYGGDLTICQTMTLREQLDAGIRFVDIRCRHIDDVFTIHHGVVYEHLNFGGGVRDICLQFLAEHPNECIVMSIKQEYDPTGNTRTFTQTFEWYLEGNRDSWYLADTMPTLDAVRGKIVLFRRFEAPYALGLQALPWHDNATFDISNTVQMSVQDQYVVPTICDIKDKWDHVEKLLDTARKPESAASTLFVNFSSGASAGAYPYTVAKGAPGGHEGVNSHLKSYLSSAPVARCGAVLMDFPEWPDDALIGLLIAQN